MKASWNKTVIAESKNTIEIEGNQYFPRKDVNMKYLKRSESQSTCPWKGLANYYDVVIDGKANKDAAWTYESPYEAAENIKDYIAFWNGVVVE